MNQTRKRTQENSSTNGHVVSVDGTDSDVKVRFSNPFRNRAVFYVILPLAMIVIMPNFILLQWYAAKKYDGSYLSMMTNLWQRQTFLGGLLDLYSSVRVTRFSVGLIGSYAVFQLTLMRIVPGREVTGPITPKGNIPRYRDNGFTIYVINMIALAAMTIALKRNGISPTIVYDNFGDILVTLNLFSLLFCVFLYFKGLFFPSTTDSGSTGNVIMDYYWGTELYPSVWGWDIKVFTNCRFGMTAWPLLVTIYALKSYEVHGVVDSMVVTTALQIVYLTKFFWWEAGYMNTIDIMMDRAGFMICWGCLCFVPSYYVSVSFYLVSHPVHLGSLWSAAILALGGAAIAINYSADWQKQRCRATNGNCLIWGKRPDVIRAEYTLESGETKESVLLVSGYWALARHFHYVPELVLAFCWSVPAKFDNLFPYSYFVLLCILLVHRSYRDDDKCSKKYGKYWQEYVDRVPCRLLPFIY